MPTPCTPNCCDSSRCPWCGHPILIYARRGNREKNLKLKLVLRHQFPDIRKIAKKSWNHTAQMRFPVVFFVQGIFAVEFESGAATESSDRTASLFCYTWHQLQQVLLRAERFVACNYKTYLCATKVL